MRAALAAAGVWQDARELPGALEETLRDEAGIEAVASLLRRPDVRRVLAVGNGASSYAAHALWLASLETAGAPAEVIPAPAGLLAQGRLRLREGDLLLAVSSSGELRDLVEAIEGGAAPALLAAVTASPESPIGAAAAARALVSVPSQRAVTHTAAFCGGVLACLAIWARACRDRTLEEAVRGAPLRCAAALEAAEGWVEEGLEDAVAPGGAVAFGTGAAWAWALEAALLLKEIAAVPCEGAETREAATSAMTALAPGRLALWLPLDGDALGAEAEEICRSRGARVLRVPGGGGDPRLAAVTGFPGALALAVVLARRGGLDPDRPAWAEAYYATARRRP